MIKLSIDTTLIDKSKLKEITRKNGDRAMFLELVLIETPNGKYGDYMVKQDSTKEEREAGKQTPILGNGKNIESRRSNSTESSAARSYPAAPASEPVESDDVPF